MRARILTWLFAFLLLGMQHGAQLHALSHVAGTLDRPQEQGLQLPADNTPCAVCALFAGGSNALASGGASVPNAAAASAATWATVSSPTVHSPTYYLSRAPPPLLL
jgi:hypothetical protein